MHSSTTCYFSLISWAPFMLIHVALFTYFHCNNSIIILHCTTVLQSNIMHIRFVHSPTNVHFVLPVHYGHKRCCRTTLLQCRKAFPWREASRWLKPSLVAPYLKQRFPSQAKRFHRVAFGVTEQGKGLNWTLVTLNTLNTHQIMISRVVNYFISIHVTKLSRTQS